MKEKEGKEEEGPALSQFQSLKTRKIRRISYTVYSSGMWFHGFQSSKVLKGSVGKESLKKRLYELNPTHIGHDSDDQKMLCERCLLESRFPQ